MKDAEFCRRLRLLRERGGLTQAELEKRAGLPALLVSQYETGSRAPGLANIKALIRGLNCTADELLEARPSSQRQHIASAECWCSPTVEFKDHVNGAAVWVHKQVQ